MNRLPLVLLLWACGVAAAADQPRIAPGASIRPDSRRVISFDSVDATRKLKLRVTIPDGLAVVRGILVVGPFSGGDTREFHKEIWYREFMHQHGFAFLGAEWSGPQAEQFKFMQASLRQIAEDSKHPELVHVPYAATGFSAGGSFASRLVAEVPENVIAAVIVGSRPRLTDVTEAHRGVPICIINGEDEDNGMAAAVQPLLSQHRPKGALWSWMAVQELGHARDGQETLAVPMLDAAVRLRYPSDADVRKGPVKLKPVDPKTGWIADNTTWKSGFTSIVPAARFTGSQERSSWLLNEDLAFVYRAYSSYDRPLMITSPRHTPENQREQVWDAGSSVTIVVDDSQFAGWKSLELFDGSTKVAELGKGPATFTVKDLKTGFHPFTVLGRKADGVVRPSAPVLVVVRNRN